MMEHSRKIRIMAVLNLTPDSFWEPSRYDMSVLESGADIIDIGAVSTRPGAPDVSEQEEWARLEPVLKTLPDGLAISIDTTRSGIVTKAHELLGHFIVNDISAGEDDPLMLPTVARLGLGYVAMHKRGNPRTMDSLCDYPEGVTAAVISYFREFSCKASRHGISDWILDPGFGFAKTDAQNMELLENLSEFKQFGKDILVGISDKRFTKGRSRELEELAVRNGADILRVHLRH
ncbi:MAG: dihydropteroate synthase [Bacteroidales bacterium]|nr:dihydropteroate synthase [Bacteroidales bacterium]